MSLARVKTWVAGEVLASSDLNSEFNNILNNATSLLTPITANFDFDGYTVTWDAAAVTTGNSTTAISWNFTPGAKAGAPVLTGSVQAFAAQTFTDSSTAGSGTATGHAFYAVARPTLAATNALVTTTDAATHYVPNAPAAGTNQTITNGWAYWADAGNVRFDEDIHWLSGQTFAQRGILAHANTDVRTYTFPDASGTIAMLSGGTYTGDIVMSGAMNSWAKGADVVSAASLPLITDGNYFDVTASNAITSMASVGVGTVIGLHFDAALTLTHHATDLILPGAANITTAAGDEAIFVEYASGDYRCLSYFTAATGAYVTAATTSASGVVEIATQAEVSAMTDTTRTLTANHNKIVLGTEQASTSGTAITFGSIPAGVRRITISFVGVSTSGTSLPMVQLGDAGGLEATGYLGSCAGGGNGSSIVAANFTTGFGLMTSTAATNIIHGSIILTLQDSTDFTWAAMSIIGQSDVTNTFMGAGSKSLSAELTQVSVTTVGGADTFDAGVINISYER